MSGAERFSQSSVTTSLAEIELLDEDGVRIVAVTGELDISNVGVLEQAGFSASNETLGVLVDLSGTDYIDSSTVGLLFRLREGLRRRGQLLCLTSTPGSSAHRVLELAGFAHEHTYQRRADAIAAIRHAASPYG